MISNLTFLYFIILNCASIHSDSEEFESISESSVKESSTESEKSPHVCCNHSPDMENPILNIQIENASPQLEDFYSSIPVDMFFDYDGIDKKDDGVNTDVVNSIFHNIRETKAGVKDFVISTQNAYLPNTHFEKIEYFISVTLQFIKIHSKKEINEREIISMLVNIWKSIGNDKNELAIFLAHVFCNTNLLTNFEHKENGERYYGRGLLSIRGKQKYLCLSILSADKDYVENPEELKYQNEAVIQDIGKIWRFFMKGRTINFKNSTIFCYSRQNSSPCKKEKERIKIEISTKSKVYKALKKLYDQ